MFLAHKGQCDPLSSQYHVKNDSILHTKKNLFFLLKQIALLILFLHKKIF
jgi:hypothetical protein